MTINGTAYNFVFLSVVPQVAGAYNISGIVDAMSDENTDVTCNSQVAVATYAKIILTYSEVGSAQ